MKTSGRTKTFETLENALALLCRARGEVAAISAAIEGREAAFFSGNPVLQEALKHLETALSLDGLTDKDANIIRAQQSIRAAVMVRAHDAGSGALRQRLLQYDQALEGQINQVRGLLGSMRSTDAEQELAPMRLSADLVQHLDAMDPKQPLIVDRPARGLRWFDGCVRRILRR